MGTCRSSECASGYRSDPWTELKIEEKQDGSGDPVMEYRVHLSLTLILMKNITTLK